MIDIHVCLFPHEFVQAKRTRQISIVFAVDGFSWEAGSGTTDEYGAYDITLRVPSHNFSTLCIEAKVDGKIVAPSSGPYAIELDETLHEDSEEESEEEEDEEEQNDDKENLPASHDYLSQIEDETLDDYLSQFVVEEEDGEEDGAEYEAAFRSLLADYEADDAETLSAPATKRARVKW